MFCCLIWRIVRTICWPFTYHFITPRSGCLSLDWSALATGQRLADALEWVLASAVSPWARSLRFGCINPKMNHMEKRCFHKSGENPTRKLSSIHVSWLIPNTHTCSFSYTTPKEPTSMRFVYPRQHWSLLTPVRDISKPRQHLVNLPEVVWLLSIRQLKIPSPDGSVLPPPGTDFRSMALMLIGLHTTSVSKAVQRTAVKRRD